MNTVTRAILLSVFMVTLVVSVQAQIPQQLNYQGIARNLSGGPISYQDITARISIIDSAAGGQVSYAETRKVRTNYVGLFNIVIGSSGATNVMGRMQNVNWPTGRKFIKLEIDPNGGGNYTLAGISELQSVPYALSASTSGTAGGDLTGTYPSPSIANNAVTSNKLANGSVNISKLDPAVVNTLNGKLNIVDTAAMLAPYAAGLNGSAAAKLNISDTSAMLAPYASSIGEKVNISDTAAMLNAYAGKNDVNTALGTKLNISDTSAMLASYASSIGDKVNISDTAAMLNAYAGKNDVNTALGTKLNISDTSAMLASYASSLNDKLNLSDTAAMLNAYAGKNDVNTALGTKLNISDTSAMLAPYASSLNDKLNLSDTAAMLNAYAGKNDVNTAFGTKLNISDTSAMLAPYASSIGDKLNISDTAAMLNAYAGKNDVNTALGTKLNISDTAAMLAPYASSLNDKLNISDTAAMLNAYAGKNDVNTALGTKLNISDTSAMLASYASSLTDKLNISDTAAMLNAYAGKNDVNTALGTKLNISDTSAMLAPYASSIGEKVNISDTAAMLNAYAGKNDVNTALGAKLNISDTSAMLASYASSLTDKLNISDTAAMLSNYAPKTGSVSGSGAANYIPKFTSPSTFGNSLIYDNGTNVGIGASPSSLFQIGGESSTDLNLKYDFVSNTSSALKLGYRNYQWRMKTNTNSGTLDPLVFSYYNGTTDITRLSITNGGISIPDNLTVTGDISGANGTLADLNVNNGQFRVDKTNNRIGFFTGNPSSLFQVGGEDNTDLNLKYDFVSNTSSALKLGYRGYQWRIKTSTNSGVLLPLVFSYYNGTIDADLLTINTTGGLVADSYAKVGGTSSQYLMADGSVSTFAGLGGSGAAGQMSYWTSANAQAGAANFTWDNTSNMLKVGPGVNHTHVDYMLDPALSTTPVASVIGDVTTATEQTILRLKRVHNQGTSYAAVADFVMTGGSGNYTQLDLRLNNPNNTTYVSAMTFTNAGRVGIGNASPGSTLDVNGTGNFSGVITANGFKKSGGTSSQFLKADGSVDANTYLTTSGAIFTTDIKVNTNITVGTGGGSSATNTVLGYNPLLVNAGGTDNVAIGQYALYSNTTGSRNTTVGRGAAFHNSTSSGITAIGWQTLQAETGAGNTALGYDAGDRSGTTYSDLTNSTFLGYSAKAVLGAIDNATAIGYNAKVDASNKIQLGNASVTAVNTSGKLTTGAVTYPNTDGTSGQALTTDGSGTISWSSVAVREVADEFTATASQVSFTLTQAPSVNSKVKMYINGIRISNTAYSITGSSLTYNPANNGSYSLTASDRIQFDYYY